MKTDEQRILDAIGGKLKPSTVPLCPGCALAKNADVVRLEGGTAVECSGCKRPTTWRTAL